MIIDKKGRLFSIISVIDLLVLIIIILGFFYYNKFVNNKSKYIIDSNNVILEFYVTSGVEHAAKALQEGKIAYDTQNKIKLGQVEEVIVNDSADYNFDNNGKVIKTGKVGFNEVKMIVKSKGRNKTDGYEINGHTYLIGDGVAISGGKSVLWMYLSNIKEAD